MQIVIDIDEDLYEGIERRDGALETEYVCNELMNAIDNGTPQQKIGKWIAQDIHNCHTDFKCSECDYIHSFMHLYGEPTADYTYCPACGAKMAESEVQDANSY